MGPRLAAFCSVLLLAAAPAVALEPYLVKDIDPLPLDQSSSPRGFVSLENGIALFGANLRAYDPEMWRSDGTPEGTYQLTETCDIGYCEEVLHGVAQAGDRFFYLAATRPEEIKARELWVTGGTKESTIDLGGPFYLDPYDIPVWVKSRGVLFFLADDGVHGRMLWRSDGTRAGTYMLNVGAGSLTEFRGKLYFAGARSGGRYALWTSDGTRKGTKMVKDVSCYALQSIGTSMIFFGAGSQRLNLWRSDGTSKGTVPLASISSPRDLELREVVALGGRFYFTTNSATQGEELWASNGTKAGTRRVTDFANAAPFHYDNENPYLVLYLPRLSAGARMVFAADDGVHGSEPWVTDGTPAGTRLLRDICPGDCWSWFIERVNVGPRLIFHASSPTQGQEPWVTDGTPGGTLLLRDICPGNCHSLAFGMVRLGGDLLFGADDGQDGIQLWKTNGTPRGTARITAFPSDVSSVQRIGAPIAGGVLYAARSRQNGDELWRTDGTVAGTHMVRDLVHRDNGGSNPKDLFSWKDRLYFLADDGIHGRELWTSDGTASGTYLIHDTPPYDGWDYADLGSRVEVGGILYMDRSTSEGHGIWRTDGTEGGTFRLTPDGIWASGPVAVGNRLFFSGREERQDNHLWTSDGSIGGTRSLDLLASGLVAFQGVAYVSSGVWGGEQQIWKSDGTPQGTVQVSFFSPPDRYFERFLGEFGGRLWFVNRSADYRHELWSTDGTEAGTRKLDIQTDSYLNDMDLLIPAGDRMFLRVSNDLWVSDGTVAGTRKIGPGFSRDWRTTILLDGRLFFIGPSGELWVSDGSEDGTKRVLTADGEPFVAPTSLVGLEGRLWFLHGNKIWSTDGTPAGTSAAVSFEADVFTGESLGAAGGRLYFSGWTPQTGHELWAIDPR